MAKIITVLSSKGGVGKSTIAMNLSFAFHKKDKKTLLVDTDPQNSISATLCISSEYGIVDLLLDKMDINSVYKKVRENLFVIPAGINAMDLTLEFKDIFEKDKLQRTIDNISNMGFNFIVFDTPPGYNTQTEALIKLSDLILTVFEPTPLSYSSYKIFEEHFLKRNSYLKDEMFLIINKLRADEISEDFSFIFKQEFQGQIIAYIPYDDSVNFASGNCLFVEEYKPDSPSALIINQLADTLINKVK